MNLSGILVIVPPAQLADGVAALNALPGVEVFHTEAETGRIVVVQEAATVDAEITGLRRIQQLPHVFMAELVYHYFAENQETVVD